MDNPAERDLGVSHGPAYVGGKVCTGGGGVHQISGMSFFPRASEGLNTILISPLYINNCTRLCVHQ